MVPAVIVFLFYHWRPAWYYLRYLVLVGYLIMYTYVVFTGYTPLVFCYILPLLSLMVLYHDIGLIILTGVAAIGINVAQISLEFANGKVSADEIASVEIRFACLLLWRQDRRNYR